MYANGANNRTVSTANSLFENTITVTPIKLEATGGVTPSYGVLNSVTSTTAGSNVRRATNLVSTTTATPTNTTVSMPFGNQATIVSTTANNNTNNVSSHANTTLGNTGATAKEKPVKTTRTQIARKPPPTLDNFWPNITNEVNSIQHVDAKHQVLPLARIKKIMKLDENAKMIAAEAPLLFAKACEYFIQELTMRAWIHTEESKRRTLQRSDIAQAIANYDQFDFLIDIVPREDIKPTSGHKKESSVANSTSTSSNTGNSIGATAAAVSTLTSPAMHVGANTTGSVKLEGTTEILSFGTPNTDMFASQTHHLQQLPTQQQQHTQPHQQLQIIQQSATHPGGQQLQYFIALPGQQAGQAQLVQQLQQQHHQQQQQQQHQQQQQQQQQQQHHHQQTQHTHLHNGLGLSIVSQPQQQTQQLILTAGPNGQLTATPAPTTATAAQQQTQTLLQNLAAQQQHQQQQQQVQQQQQQQQIQLLQQVVGPNGELTNVPITINANQLNLLRLQMQQQQQQQQQVAAASQQQVLMPTQLLTHPQLLHQLSGHAATAIATTTTSGQQQQQQQQTHTLTNTVNNVANTNTGANIFLNATSSSAQATQTHQVNGSGNNSNNNSSNNNNSTIITTERNLANTYRQNC